MELFFLDKKISYSVIEDKDLNSLGQYEFDILILPSVEILSDQAIENLEEFLNAGKSIFILGKLGSFDPQLMTRKPDGLEILAGLNIEDLPVTEKISEKHLFFNSNFLTQNLNGDFETLILNIFNPLYARKIQINTVNTVFLS